MARPLIRGQRSRTAHLLLCAADIAIAGTYVFGPGWEAAPRLGLGRAECRLAERAVASVRKEAGLDPERAKDLDEYVATVLEAARRLQERSWP